MENRDTLDRGAEKKAIWCMKQLKKTKEDWLRMKEEMERIRDSAMPVDLFSSEDKDMLLSWQVEVNKHGVRSGESEISNHGCLADESFQ